MRPWVIAGVLLTLAGGCRSARRASAADDLPRVVSLHDVTTDMLVALGAGKRLVGVGEPVDLDADTRAAIARVPRVDGAESIVATRPTLVVGTAVVGQRSPELVAFLRGRGIVVWLAHPTALPDVLAAVSELGKQVGKQATAAKLIEGLRARMEGGEPGGSSNGAVGQAGNSHPPPRLRGASDDARGQPLRVFVYDCCDPAFTAGATSVLTDLIGRAGGRNVFADVAADWTKVSWEEVIARRPELIIIHDYDFAGQGDVGGKRKQLAALRSLAGIPVTVLPLRYALGGLPSFEGLERLRLAIRAQRRAG